MHLRDFVACGKTGFGNSARLSMDVPDRAPWAIIRARPIGARCETWIAPKGMGLWTREQNANRRDSTPLLQRVDAVEKVPKYGAANFPLKDETSGDRHSMGPQLDYGSRR
jgi:hypothetical protein